MSAIIFEIEDKQRHLQTYLSSPISSFKKLVILNDFFAFLLSTNNNNLLLAYGAELLGQCSTLLESCDPTCVNPIKHAPIISTFEVLICRNVFPDEGSNLEQALSSFKLRREELLGALNGKDGNLNEGNNYVFPLVETQNGNENIYGILDSVTVKIIKGKSQTFHIIPSEKEIEARIKTQIETSWMVAIKYTKQFIKNISSHHDVIISFDKRVGFYVGDSLGAVLTLAYIGELLHLYNSPISITAKPGNCFTGSVLRDGLIPPISDEIIKKKVELVFYSPIKTFVVPKEDELAAESIVDELKIEHPNRDLRIIAVRDVEDLISRRNIVEIKRQKKIVRLARTIKQNWLPTILILTLILITMYIYFVDFDSNPAILDHDDITLYVKNKSGKVLWTKDQRFYKPYMANENFKKNYFRIIDIDNDAKNEVLVANEEFIDEENASERGRITCYNYDGTVRWKYSFHDTVRTTREVFRNNWNPTIMFDTASVEGRKILICASSNEISFACAIYKLDLLKGTRLPGTLWHSGQCGNGLVRDVNNDGIEELIVVGCNNSFNHAGVIFVLRVDKMNGHAPSTEEYKFYEFPKAELLAYIKIPQTDLSTYLGNRNSIIEPTSLIDRNDIAKIVFHSTESVDSSIGGLYYFLDYNLKDFEVVISSGFAYPRDKLVRQNKLSLPFSDTKEYMGIIRRQIHYWNGNEFVHSWELK